MDDQQKGILSLRNLLKILSFLCFVFFFCPSFLISCGGEKLGVSIGDVTLGEIQTQNGSQKISDPHLVYSFGFLIAIALFVIAFIVKRSIALSSTIAGLALVDVIIHFAARSSAKKAAKNNGCGFETTGVFVFSIIVLILIIAIGLVGAILKINLAADVRYAFSGIAIPTAAAGVRSVSQVHARPAGGGQVVGYCENCGSPIHAGKKFCTSCGTPVPETAAVESEPAPAANKFCPYCGAKLEEDSAFCSTCGKKLEVMRL